jgi:hypothetical protein
MRQKKQDKIVVHFGIPELINFDPLQIFKPFGKRCPISKANF